MRRINPWMLAMSALILSVSTGCAATGGTVNSAQNDSPSSQISLDSCGREVVFDAPPRSVLAVGSEAPALLSAAGAGDKLTHYAGSLEVPFDKATKAVVHNAQRIAKDSHDVSYEMILDSGADVVIGTDIAAGVDLDSLAERLDQAGVQMLTVSGYCAGFDDRSTGGLSGFEQIYRDVESYGKLFGTEQIADASVATMRGRVAAATERAELKIGQRALALYVPSAGTLGSYGRESLVSEQMELLGLANVFSDVPKRYFEPSTEELIASVADKVFAMYLPTGSSTLETDEQVFQELRDRPELDGLSAIEKEDAVVPLNYYYSSPGPLAVDGVELLADRLSKK